MHPKFASRACLEIVGAARLQRLSVILDRRFRRRALFAQALMHRSCRLVIGGTPVVPCYEPLEHLGDRILGACVCLFIHRTFPARSEEFYTRVLAHAVTNEQLSAVACALGLTDLLVTDDSFSPTPQNNSSIAADMFEALCAALYLDGGMRAVEHFLQRTLFDCVVDVAEKCTKPSKKTQVAPKDKRPVRERLAGLCRARGFGEISFDTRPAVDDAGRGTFVTHILANGVEIGQGRGISEPNAECNAANNTLLKLGG